MITMTVEEARTVLWLRNNHRPLGELLDQGYLNERRLAWAAEKAYDPKLKEAAAVLLEWVRHNPAPSQQPPDSPAPVEPLPEIQAGITVQQARAARWPFKPHKNRPMGELVDTQMVRLKDLAYAIENAWDERVRQAAIVLMAMRLNQVVDEPPPPTGPLRVVSAGRSYAERMQFLLTMIQGFIFGAVLSLLCLFLVQSILKSAKSQPGKPIAEILASPVSVIAVVILLALAIGAGWLFSLVLDLATKQLDKRIAAYRKGQEGEDRVVEAVRQNLDGNWTLFRNVTLPGRNKGDIDLVLVGPTGVWTLEVKTFTGEYRNIGEQWEYRAGNRWKLRKPSPSRQAQDNAARLSSFFKADGVKQWVTPAVAWANPDSPLLVENPMVAIWTLDRLPEELGNIWQGQAIREPVLARIVEKLTVLCQSKNEEESE
jgi:hypothetical protein